MYKIGITALLLFVGSIAHAADANPPKTATATKDTKDLCYWEDRAYSEGAIVQGQRCERESNMRVTNYDGKEQQRSPLLWRKYVDNGNLMK
jgi:hypothetical protein